MTNSNHCQENYRDHNKFRYRTLYADQWEDRETSRDGVLTNNMASTEGVKPVSSYDQQVLTITYAT